MSELGHACACGWQPPNTAFARDPVTKKQITGVLIVVPCPTCGAPHAFTDREIAAAARKRLGEGVGKL